MGHVTVEFNGSNINITQHACWHLRGENITRLVKEAFTWISPKSIKIMRPFSKNFYLDDHGHGEYTMSTDRYTDRTIPCFSFDHWKECKINDYTETCKQITKKGLQHQKYDKLFWIGQVSHPTRKVFIEKYKHHQKMNIIPLPDHWGHAQVITTPYVSLPDHCEYKYLIDLQGHGYSARAKFLMHSRRPMFFQKRSFHEYWFWDMQPFQHYIPIKEDLSDFDQMFMWAESNPVECKKIAENAFNFAQEKLKRDDALARLKNILFKLGTGEFK
jgi:hypothetical protein